MTTLTTRRPTASSAATVTTLGAVALLVALVQIALHTRFGQQHDQAAMTTVVGGRDTQLAVLSLLGYVSIGAVVAVVVGCGVVALLRGQVRLAIAATLVIAGANVTTQVLKHSLLDRPDLGLGLGSLNSLPSGHTTVVASAVGAMLLVAPRLARPFLVAVGGFATTLTGASTVVAGWHRPSDVIAALLVSLVWTAAAAAVLGERHRPAPGTLVSAVAGCAAAMVFLVLIGVRPLLGWDGFVDAGFVLGTLTLVAAVFVTLCSRVAPGE